MEAKSILIAIFLSVIFTGGTFIHGEGQSASSVPKLVKKWETPSGILTPESVLWDPVKKIFYVSDINGSGSAKDGNGFISLINTDGKIIELHWVDGLDSPKGLGMADGKLYVADLAQLAIIDISQRKVIKKLILPGAAFLNDIATDRKGNVYISDSKLGRVYRYADGKATVYLDDPKIKGANGLLVWHNFLWIMGSKGIFQYNPTDKSLKLFTDAAKGCDGITVVNGKDFIVSHWQGQVAYVNTEGKATTLLDVKDEGKNTADLYYLQEKRLLVIPTFNGNSVMGYELK